MSETILETDGPSDKMRNGFYFYLKVTFVLKISKFCPNFFVM